MLCQSWEHAGSWVVGRWSSQEVAKQIGVLPLHAEEKMKAYHNVFQYVVIPTDTWGISGLIPKASAGQCLLCTHLYLWMMITALKISLKKTKNHYSYQEAELVYLRAQHALSWCLTGWPCLLCIIHATSLVPVMEFYWAGGKPAQGSDAAESCFDVSAARVSHHPPCTLDEFSRWWVELYSL